MDMKEFVEVIKESQIAGKNKVKIIYQLFQAAGSKSVGIEKSKQSPSDSTIQKWLSNKGNQPKGSEYFYNSKIEDKEKAHDFLRKTASKDQWIELKDLFRQWHNINLNDEEFYIDTETEDFITFSTSFWRQFASFFVALRMWDSLEEQDSEMYMEQINSSNDIANEIISVFKEKYKHYKVYKFIPKYIENIFNSLSIYKKILCESTESLTQDNVISDCNNTHEFKKMYCNFFPNYDFFIFSAVTYCEGYGEFNSSGMYIILKFSEDFDYDEIYTNTWLVGSFKYAFANQSIFEGQYDDETIIWKESQGEIIIIEADPPIDGDYDVIEDCHQLINKMCDLAPLIDEFIAVINEKIIKKYENVSFDNNTRLLYNNIKLYKKTLKNYKKYLTKFGKLKKEKDEYFAAQALENSFSAYAAFQYHNDLTKPKHPFSECYLKQTEAEKIISKLKFHHESLVELYAEIFSYEKTYTT